MQKNIIIYRVSLDIKWTNPDYYYYYFHFHVNEFAR